MIGREASLAWSEDVATLALLHDRELTPGLLAGLKAIGFKRNDSPEMDPKHPVNLQNLICLEYSR